MHSTPAFLFTLLCQILQNISKSLIALSEILNSCHDLLECILFARILQLLSKISQLVCVRGIVIDHVIHQRAQLSHRRAAVLVVMVAVVMVMMMVMTVVVIMMMLVRVVMIVVVMMLVTVLMEMVMSVGVVMIVGMTVCMIMGMSMTVVGMLVRVVVRMFMAVNAVVFVTHSIESPFILPAIHFSVHTDMYYIVYHKVFVLTSIGISLLFLFKQRCTNSSATIFSQR